MILVICLTSTTGYQPYEETIYATRAGPVHFPVCACGRVASRGYSGVTHQMPAANADASSSGPTRVPAAPQSPCATQPARRKSGCELCLGNDSITEDLV